MGQTMKFFFKKRFLPLFVTQFLGAFNDNFLKNALVVLITYRLAAEHGLNSEMLVAMAAGIFILPYFLFSALAGQIADKIARNRIARVVKSVEIGLMILATIGFFFGNVWFLLAVLFGMGIHSTFFGPIKYALLPQHLQENELLSGNAAIEAGTFLAILLGTIGGGLTIMYPSGAELTGVLLIAVAVIGYFTSRQIPDAPAPQPEMKIGWNIFTETKKLIGEARKDKNIMRSIHGISWFWFIGATFLAQFPVLAKNVLHAQSDVVTLFLTIFSIGIGVGSFLCNALLKGKESLRYIFAASIGISIFAFDLFWSASHAVTAQGNLISLHEFLNGTGNWRILIDLLGVAICGGLYIVPLYTFLQEHGDKHVMARLIAANNVVNAIYMVVSALLLMVAARIGIAIPQVFAIIAAVNLVVAFLMRRPYVTGNDQPQVS
jgi:acyl-[acyl-carrier-protein]-phospholipid O-acyltransferase/long-chain-fatty-acid--[acyl-carrier-protein] ligase